MAKYTTRKYPTFKFKGIVGLRGPRGPIGDVTSDVKEIANRASLASERAAIAGTSAVAAANLAEKARDAAFAAGNAYLSVDEGRRAVGEGEFFTVVGGSDVSACIYLKTGPQSELLITSIPAAEQVRLLVHRTETLEGNFIDVDQRESIIGGWVDAGKRFLGYIWSNAQFEFVRGVRHTVGWPEDHPYASIVEFETGGVVLGVSADGRLAFRADRSSARELTAQTSYRPDHIYSILRPEAWASADLGGWCDIGPNLARGFVWIDGVPISAIVRTDARGCAMDESPPCIELITASGQSLCKGGGGDPVTLPTPPAPHSALMLNIGTRDVFSGLLDERTVIDFVPACEKNSDGLGESQGTALMAALYQRQLKQKRSRAAWCYVSHGKGGQRIADLGIGTAPFQNGMTEIRRASALASEYRKKLKLKMHTWTHGEADRDLTDRSTYADLLSKYFSDYQEGASAILGEGANGIAFSIDQLTASIDNDASDVALAQLDVVEAGIHNAYISTAKYFFKDRYGYLSSVHLRSAGYDLLGEYHAKVYDRISRGNGAWTGLRPIGDPKIIDRNIRLELYVPVPPLVLDYVTLPDAGKGGFRFRDNLNSADIARVSVLDDGLGNPGNKYGTGILDIELSSAPIGGDMTLEYALSSSKNQKNRARAWGNLKDSDPTTSVVIEDTNLWNWCVIFKKTVDRN